MALDYFYTVDMSMTNKAIEPLLCTKSMNSTHKFVCGKCFYCNKTIEEITNAAPFKRMPLLIKAAYYVGRLVGKLSP